LKISIFSLENFFFLKNIYLENFQHFNAMHDEIEKKFHIDDSWVDMWTFYILGAQVYQLRQGNFKALEENFTIYIASYIN
jgi:hypothetical protein